MRKPVISIIISINFSLRYLLRSSIIEKLLEKYYINIFISWNDPELTRELIALGCNVIIIPKTIFNEKFYRSNNILKLWHQKKVIKIGNDNWYIERCKDGYYSLGLKIVRILRDCYHMLLIMLPFYISRIKNEIRINSKNSNLQDFYDLIKHDKSDLVITLTPFHTDEKLLLKAFEEKGIPIISSILSFDNISKRGIIPFNFLKVFVWNKQNKETMLLAHKNLNESDVEIIGPVQFDFYYNNKFSVNKEDWLSNELLRNKKVILYSGGPSLLFNNEIEYLEYIDEAINNGDLKNSIILLRVHPMDQIGRWKKIVNQSKNIVFSDVWGQDSDTQLRNKYQNITEDDIKILKSDLMFSDVHISLCSTMVIDGSIFDKPQIGPAFSNKGYFVSKCINNIYKQHHFKDIIGSGALKLSYNKHEFIDDIKYALSNPNELSLNRKTLINDLCHFNDGNSSDRFLKNIFKII